MTTATFPPLRVNPNCGTLPRKSRWKAKAFPVLLSNRRMKYLIISATAYLVISGCAAPSQMSADAEVKRLCAIDGGIKVYESVRLPADKFDKWGSVHVPPKDNASDTSEFYFEREQTF